ncbi:putative Ig domain-containing protein, partial [Candidatus Puniceispirillum sp.]|nr:putative Ig domain-containing protein [Candidatus Puniceispirillum sp.]
MSTSIYVSGNVANLENHFVGDTISQANAIFTENISTAWELLSSSPTSEVTSTASDGSQVTSTYIIDGNAGEQASAEIVVTGAGLSTDSLDQDYSITEISVTLFNDKGQTDIAGKVQLDFNLSVAAGRATSLAFNGLSVDFGNMHVGFVGPITFDSNTELLNNSDARFEISYDSDPGENVVLSTVVFEGALSYDVDLDKILGTVSDFRFQNESGHYLYTDGLNAGDEIIESLVNAADLNSLLNLIPHAAGNTVFTHGDLTIPNGVENAVIEGTDDINLTGNDHDNSITGNVGNDTLAGGSGDDTLAGGSGDDTLDGGIGSDKFDYRKGDGNDIIVGFEDGIDEIRFFDFTDAEQEQFVSETTSDGSTLITLSDGSTILKKAVTPITDIEDTNNANPINPIETELVHTVSTIVDQNSIIVDQDSIFQYQLVSDDTDTSVAVGELTYVGVDLPYWMGISSSGLITGSPQSENVGLHEGKVLITDGSGLVNEATFAVAVNSLNEAPYKILYGEDASYTSIINSFANIQFDNDGSHNGLLSNTGFVSEIELDTTLFTSTGDFHSSSVTALADGNVAAVWSRDIWKDVGDGTWSSSSSFSLDRDIFYRVFDPSDGNFVTDEVRVTSSLVDEEIETVTANDDGSFNISYSTSDGAQVSYLSDYNPGTSQPDFYNFPSQYDLNFSSNGSLNYSEVNFGISSYVENINQTILERADIHYLTGPDRTVSIGDSPWGISLSDSYSGNLYSSMYLHSYQRVYSETPFPFAPQNNSPLSDIELSGNLHFIDFSDEHGNQEKLVFTFFGNSDDPSYNSRNSHSGGVEADTFYKILKSGNESLAKEYLVYGDNQIWDSTGNEIIYAGAGDDRIWWSVGSDLIDGGLGYDTLKIHQSKDSFDINYLNETTVQLIEKNTADVIEVTSVEEFQFYDDALASGDSLKFNELFTALSPPAFTINKVSQSGDTVVFGLYADPSQDPGGDGIGSFSMMFDYDPSVITVDDTLVTFGSGLSGQVGTHDTSTGQIDIGGFAFPSVTEFSLPFMEVTATLVDASQPVV